MEWKKSRIVTVIWQCGEFCITEDADGEETPYRLNSPNADAEWFADLETAKAVAALQNRLAIIEAENERLRMALGERRQADAFERSVRKPDDGHGIPTSKPAVAAIAAELNAVMADNEAAAGEGAEACCANIANGPQLAYTREHEYPF